MRVATALRLAGVFALALSTTSCVVTTDGESIPPSFGTLTVDYTIAGSTDSVLCDSYGVTDAELVVYTSSGAYVTELYAPCPDFRVSVSIEPGLYIADVTLVDGADRAVSITKPLDAIRVVTDTELVIDVDFPPDSML